MARLKLQCELVDYIEETSEEETEKSKEKPKSKKSSINVQEEPTDGETLESETSSSGSGRFYFRLFKFYDINRKISLDRSRSPDQKWLPPRKRRRRAGKERSTRRRYR